MHRLSALSLALLFTLIAAACAHSSQLKGVVARMSPDTPAQIFRVETWEWTS